MRTTFRAKLVAIAGTAALALLLVIVASSLISDRVEEQLAVIQKSHLPRINLGPKLEFAFDKVRQGFQDAVAAHDTDALAAVGQSKEAFLEQLTAAGGALEPSQVATLRAGFEDYCDAMHDVSSRLIADETGQALVGKMRVMQEKQVRFLNALKDATSFDQRALVEAFAAAQRAVDAGGTYRAWISITSFALVTLLSARVGKGVLRSLADVTSGLERFGKGDFRQPIRVARKDECGAVAQKANEMAASLERIGNESKKAEMRFRALMESAPDAMVIVNQAGRIVLVNARTETVFGYSRDELLGEELKKLVSRGLGDEPPSRSTGSALDLYGRRSDGTQFPIELTSNPLDTDEGALVSCAIRDITERKISETALKVANKELEAFSYSVAHDLRAPLRGMNGFAQVLLDGYKDKLDAEGKDFLEEILHNAQRMGALIDALLSLARVTRSDLKPQRVDLSTVVHASASQLAAAETQRKVEVVIEEDLWADVDPQLARAVMDNLLGNAWKFTSKVPLARVEFGHTEHNGTNAFFIRDNGAGFDMAYATNLFAPFQRLHTVSEFPGTGIGLATVQRIIHRHGGNIWAAGSVDGGATFYFSLPTRAIGITS